MPQRTTTLGIGAWGKLSILRFYRLVAVLYASELATGAMEYVMT